MIKRLFYILAIVLFASVGCDAFDINATDCDDADATTWCIQTDDTTFDGDTDCFTAGPTPGACAGGDTLYLEGEERTESIIFQDLIGAEGNPITILNDPTNRVIFNDTSTPSGGAIIRFDNCQYVDLLGNNKSGHSWSAECQADSCYGIKIIKSDSTGVASVLFQGDNTGSDYVTVGYIEISQTNQTSDPWDDGFKIGVAADGVVTHTGIELHHNWIHDVQYTCIYGGSNEAGSTAPYVADILLHHNLCEDAGSYGMNVKGVLAGSTGNAIYNNTIRNTGANCLDPTANCYEDSVSDFPRWWRFRAGIAIVTEWNTGSGVNVYENKIYDAQGMGISVREGPSNIYNNIITGAGSACTYENTISLGVHFVEECSGINILEDTSPSGAGLQIYDNKIVESYQWGIYGRASETPLVSINRNIITENVKGTPGYSIAATSLTVGANTADCGDAWGTLTDCPNVYDADTDSICFTTWSDDSDYSNDDFTLCCDYDYTSIAANACGATTTPVSGVKFSGAEYN